MSGDAQKARQCGCDDYLSKPLDERCCARSCTITSVRIYQRSAARHRRQAHRILIVDDEPLNVDYLQQELEELGYDTMSARDGQEALECVATDPPDLILLDILMPIMDGFEVCRALKGDDATRLIPIVIMTTLDGIDDRIKGIEAGADDFLTKPVNQRQLIARLQTSLRSSTPSTGSCASCARSRTTSPSSFPSRSSAWLPRTRKRRSSTSASGTSRSYSSISAAIAGSPNA